MKPVKGTPEPASPIRVMVLVSTLTIGGAEQLLADLLLNIDPVRFQIHLCFLGEPGLLGEELLSLGIPATTNLCGSRLDILAIPRLARFMKSQAPHVLLLINHRNTIFFGVPAAFLAGVREVINWQNETYRRYSMHWITMASRRLFHQLGIGKVVAASRGHGTYIEEVEKIPPRKIRVIYNGVDPERTRSLLDVRQAKERLGLPTDAPVVVMVAALRPDKAHDVLLHAAAEVLSFLPEVRFLIVGDGPCGEYLKGLSRKLGITERVLFLGFRRDIADILKACDICVLSTRPEQETLSVAVIEAMASGLPVICTDVGFMREVVMPGKTGELVPVGDPRSLAREIRKLMEAPELRKWMGENARHLVLERLTVKSMVKGFESLFTETR